MRTVRDILTQSKIIAIVGLSPRPDRASHEVAHYLQSHGYRIVGVNPACAGTQILGQAVYSTLREAADALACKGVGIDLVDCFRKSADMEPIAADAVAIGARCLWMQQGIVNQAAAHLASAAGLDVVMDRCTKIEHRQMGGG